MDTPATRYCTKGFHDWERELRAIEGVECVVQSCRRCGVTEVCWSPASRGTALQLNSRHHGSQATRRKPSAPPLQLI